MKKRSRQGLRRFRVEVWSYGNYVERITELERALAKRPRKLEIEIVGTGEIPPDAALRFRAALMERSPGTRIVTHARSTLQGGSLLLWLMGDRRRIRDGARVYFRPTTLSEDDLVTERGDHKVYEPRYRDSYSTIDPDEGDYAQVLESINEFLPVEEMAGRLIGVSVLRQFGLVENDSLDSFLAGVLSKGPRPVRRSSKPRHQQHTRHGMRKAPRQIRR